MRRIERRLINLTADNRRSVIPRNFRVARNWTQEIAAEWFGVSVRTWRRYEHDGAPRPVLKRILDWSKNTEAGRWHARWLS